MPNGLVLPQSQPGVLFTTGPQVLRLCAGIAHTRWENLLGKS